MSGPRQYGRTALHIEQVFVRRAIALVAACVLANWHGFAAAQPAGATVIHGSASIQQTGNSLLVTTTNGTGTSHSAIDWRSFSVPSGSVTRFAQPGVDSTSINRVTGGNPSQILGTLSSNGRLVLVNPSGIAVGAGAVVDTAGFTASTLQMSDADARAGRLRFAAAGSPGPLSVDGRVLARGGDVVLLGTDVNVGPNALVQAPAGAVIVAAGQRVELTARGLEGIFFELAAPSDRVIHLGRLEGDAVGIFASQLTHSGIVQANTVARVEDRLFIRTLLKAGDDEGKDRDDKADQDKGKDKPDPDKGRDDKADQDKDKGKGKDEAGPDKGKDDKDKGRDDQADHDHDHDKGKGKGKDKDDKDKDNAGNGGGGKGSGSGSGENRTGADGADTGTAGQVDSTGGAGSGAAPPPSTTASAPPPAPPTPAQEQSASQYVRQQALYTPPATTPAGGLNVGRTQDRYAGVVPIMDTTKKADAQEKEGSSASDATVMGGSSICTR